MGKYSHIGNAEFTSVRRDEYVDKSMLIKYVNGVLGTQRKFMCVTRARRFGKSIAQAIQNSDQLLHATLAGDEEAVAKAIELVHQDNTSI